MTMTWALASVAFVTLVVGEAWRVGPNGHGREAPLAKATALALAMSVAWPRSGSDPSDLITLAGPLLLAATGVVLVSVVRRRGQALAPDLGRVMASMLVAGVLVRLPLGRSGTSLIERADNTGEQPTTVAVWLLVVAVLAVAVPMVGRSLLTSRGAQASPRAQVVSDLARHGPLGLATATTAVVMSLGLNVLGSAALVLFLVPLMVLQPAVSRQRRLRVAQRQTLFALSRLTEEAGLTAPGHAARVAGLAVPIARSVGVEDADLPDVEAAGLLHDIGQVRLRRPIPGGATIEVSRRDQRDIATTGAAILARTAELTRLSGVVADVGVPHHRAVERGDVSLQARVLRVVSAYDDLTGRGTRLGGGAGPVEALERLRRSTPYEYDPVVLDALVRHLERRGVLSAAQAAGLRPPLDG